MPHRSYKDSEIIRFPIESFDQFLTKNTFICIDFCLFTKISCKSIMNGVS